MDTDAIKTYLDAADWGAVAQPQVRSMPADLDVPADTVDAREMFENHGPCPGSAYINFKTFELLVSVASVAIKEKLLALMKVITGSNAKVQLSPSYLGYFNNRYNWRILTRVEEND